MKHRVTSRIIEFVAAYPKEYAVRTQWGTPIVGFADASDPIFRMLSSVASPTHAVPQDFLAGAKTVIAFFIPFSKDMTRTNIKDRNCSKDWAAAYVETNELIRQISMDLNEFFMAEDLQAVMIPATHNWDEEKLISDWSHRHVAYIAGIGNFGKNNMLITDQGCCGRLGSFITSAVIEPDKRDTRESCLYKYDGSCQKCVDRCVNTALDPDGFNRFKCYDMLLENEKIHRSVGYADVCGKCLVAVPCAHMDPVKGKLRAKQRK
ncbi:MAG: epoxyqueuosine reductase [Desulfobacteraceae bacterium]|nr:MAG: epoxyqueuosine reductase [Desulfobacteraceae bacterium]